MFKRLVLAIVSSAFCIGIKAQTPDGIISQFQSLQVFNVENRITGISYPDNCPVKPDELRYLRILHYGYDGKVHLGEMICNAAIADDLLDIFIALFDAKYPICSIRLIDDFGGDDALSMDANNSSCFNFRTKTGQKVLSAHALGLAVDINPVENPYVHGDRILPASGAEYADRNSNFKHKIDKDDLCYKLFKEKGFQWGGEWRSAKDYQHFEKMDAIIR